MESKNQNYLFVGAIIIALIAGWLAGNESYKSKIDIETIEQRNELEGSEARRADANQMLKKIYVANAYPYYKVMSIEKETALAKSYDGTHYWVIYSGYSPELFRSIKVGSKVRIVAEEDAMEKVERYAKDYLDKVDENDLCRVVEYK